MLNLDFHNAKAMRLDALDWSASPMPGVERKRLEREEAESGRATSVVRYAPGSEFRSHPHPGGEEFLVLDGVFSDETGDFPKLTYVRNPIGSSHAPSSARGCLLFVKLHQMRDPSEERLVAELSDCTEPERVLYEDAHERVRFIRGVAGEVLMVSGAEVLVVEGELTFRGARYSALSWLRVPRGHEEELTLAEDCIVWTKDRHLPE